MNYLIGIPGDLEWLIIICAIFLFCIVPLITIASIILDDSIDKHNKVFWVLTIIITNWVGVIFFGFRYGFDKLFSFRKHLN